MVRGNVSDLIAFLAVARAGSFTRGAGQLGISQPALSQTIKELEGRLGLRLLSRTTRSVSTTEAGERLLRTIAPHFDGIEAGLAALTELRDKPAGTIRISVGDQPSESILLPVVAQLLPQYPDLNVEISVNNGFVDIVAERFDAGVRLGETLAQDMIAVPIGPDLRMGVVGSPAYLERKPAPRTPHDLSAHACIGMRYTPEGGIGIWDFDKDGRAVNVRVECQLVVSTISLARLAALQGVGLAYLPLDYVEPYIKAGELVSVLSKWCGLFPGYHLYYPSRRQHSAAFALLVDALRRSR
ncbi:HTH-type transcriptional regulator DmlR [Variibacter gotjawalensis]|uniref:HTH-type transcriptional regulator DmlR n=1 Tax=Variibacter gotjawalensis TaxID=1333996 RepID=A0A0S3PRV6_9BRAD|nr:LysR family transcriptional regulator [Variibacter gotjawalensis]NIK48914.1 DNA-binding transcriptional LysR family regulator [Variibacter gotjawalensis]RZS50770.1 DNA-binding transcriptional LysR family regulator [Variibacter gotjawalensis]BAT58604.1 HTH-type transcriptional regulator DmlR [Variibacter gotjawalensis]